MVKVAGIDIGNYGVKAVFGEKDEDQFTIPTLVKPVASRITNMNTEGRIVDDLLSYVQVKFHSKALSNQYNNVPLLVGQAAVGGREMVQGSRKHKEDLPVICALTAMALRARKINAKKKVITETFAPVFGIPVGYFSFDVRDEFESRMEGSHVVEILTPGYECTVTVIIEQNAVVPEDAIYVYDLERDWNGKVVDPTVKEQDVFIIGIGQLTTDCGYVSGMAFDDMRSFPVEFGAANTKDRFILHFDTALSRRVPPTNYRIETRNQLDRIIANDYIIRELGESIKDQFEDYVKEDALYVGDQILNKAKMLRLVPTRVCAIGGALNIYKNDIINRFTASGYKLEIPEKPEYATARALYKWGMTERSGFHEEVGDANETAV